MDKDERVRLAVAETILIDLNGHPWADYPASLDRRIKKWLTTMSPPATLDDLSGLQLNEKQLHGLGLATLPVKGQTMRIEARVTVLRVAEEQGPDEMYQGLKLQIMDLKVK